MCAFFKIARKQAQGKAPLRKHHDRRSCPQQLATSEGSGALPVKPEPIDKIRDRELRQQVFKISFFFGAMKIPGIAPRDGNFVYHLHWAHAHFRAPVESGFRLHYVRRGREILNHPSG